jgi:prepilin-type processing-associated H-X9-DG protein
MQCTNGLKQIGIAAQNMVDIHHYLPSGTLQKGLCIDLRASKGWGDYAYRDRLGWINTMLPFIEQTAIYDLVSQNASNGLRPDSVATSVNDKFVKPWDATYNNGTAEVKSPYAMPLPSFLCPSDETRAAEGAIQYTSYRACMGDFWQHWQAEETRGAFAQKGTKTYGLEGIKDGTSNTMLCSEAVISSGNNNRIKGGLAKDVTKATPNMGKASDCNARRGAKGQLSGAYENSASGRRWGDSYHIFGCFTANLPPNSPSCSEAGNETAFVMVSASSNHSGGVNAVACDGSVRFVSETISCTNLDKLPTDAPWNATGEPQWWTSESIYGVWGSFATRAGGESVSF